MLLRTGIVVTLALTAGCEATTVFKANFEFDAVGAPPPLMPPEKPPGNDRMEPGSSLVKSLTQNGHSFKVLHIESMSSIPSEVECIPQGPKKRNLNKKDILTILIEGQSAIVHALPLTILVQDSLGADLSRLELANGQFTLSNAPRPINISYAAGMMHNIVWKIDFDEGTAYLAIYDGTGARDQLADVPLLNKAYGRPGSVFFRYEPSHEVTNIPTAYDLNGIMMLRETSDRSLPPP